MILPLCIHLLLFTPILGVELRTNTGYINNGLVNLAVITEYSSRNSIQAFLKMQEIILKMCNLVCVCGVGGCTGVRNICDGLVM
ncbi:Hypothetical predicted protein [Octopus vulgaris]|uniref:Secreted protein n=1 Tax=Octopus vulgaris TaxID=6645 RepID=A0AA36F854_OCTVU|nr:Hypothetical predicted protein [Octopus vulgaris]